MSNATRNLLIELLVEELPPKSLKQLGESFGALLFQGLQKLHNLGEGAQLATFASPRRLAAHITHVHEIAVQRPRKMKLMPVSVAIDANGEYTPAFRKKLRQSCGYPDDFSSEALKERISREFDGKTEFLFHADVAAELPLSVNLLQVLRNSIEMLPIAKVMTYQLADGWSSVSFVRPVHGVVALHGAEIVPAIEVLGLTAGNKTQGHRFESSLAPIVLKHADSYAQQLETEGAVIAGFAERRNEIIGQIEAIAAKEGLKPVEDDALLDEVTALVEHPNVLLGEFESGFLDVPHECLVLTMKVNQKYFPLLNASGSLSHKFLIVSNIRPADASKIVAGNERVLRSRLADAKFFFDQDRKKTLASRVEGLRKVVYHNKLGTLAERVERIWAIAQAVGMQLGGSELAAQAGEAAMLCKADLLTDMVGEFPELQGTMGRYYAKHDGLNDDVADAIEDHYKPRFAGDDLPRGVTGICVALADKLETLVGMFSIGNIPTGDKDPFALRRQALGVIRILDKKAGKLDLPRVIEEAIKAFPPGSFTYKGSFSSEQHLMEFFYDRLASSLYEKGYKAQEVDAVLALRPKNLSDVSRRLAAVRLFSALPEAESLAATNKRVGNILKKADAVVAGGEANAALLQAPAEQALYQALSRIVPKADAAFAVGDYSASLKLLAALKEPVDNFFDNVMVNTEDEMLRNNRLALLAQLHQTMNRVADISKLAA